MLQRAVWEQGTGRLTLLPLEPHQSSTDGSGQSTEEPVQKNAHKLDWSITLASLCFTGKQAKIQIPPKHWPQRSFLICPSSSCSATVPVCRQWTMLTTMPSTATSHLKHKCTIPIPDWKHTSRPSSLAPLTWQPECRLHLQQGGAPTRRRRLAADWGPHPQTDHRPTTAAAAEPEAPPSERPPCRLGVRTQQQGYKLRNHVKIQSLY